jgi:hypothetical protein
MQQALRRFRTGLSGPTALAERPTNAIEPAAPARSEGRVADEKRWSLSLSANAGRRLGCSIVLTAAAVVIVASLVYLEPYASPRPRLSGIKPDKGPVSTRNVGTTSADATESVAARSMPRVADSLRIAVLHMTAFPMVSGPGSFRPRPDLSGVRVGDRFHVEVRLNRPAYFYILSFTPDATDHVWHPATVDLEPRRTDAIALEFPAHLVTVRKPGLHVFVVVASDAPLPSYRAWKRRAGSPPWQPTVGTPTDRTVWTFDRQRWEASRPPPPVMLAGGSEPPPSLVELCDFLARQNGVVATRALAFPVNDDPGSTPAP